ncbi:MULTISPECIES: hypothetical protein [unclassified Herbaspirillum]|uniref:hypothetical protein n=1 Tax=unclassified Herbaspirillum TaxID=2624150 RepID=UPI001153A5AB|nr:MULTISPECIES: hypothetical protein [unclassified Herbaspirillum]MBB5391342.1 hypothetical protein [Herbaspirillum sp. SJZ102]TQK12971.1 hypothetical protein FB599_0378 [Herbaspirillum sp. SJZ130]TQK14975.1 hypothetical protein FB598_0316 [Herbaspirillum sp. SJZ106]TWC67330.1 hypothetical protein FB597_104140 [Herbaspirillum sp. SJZ099]
MSDNQNPYLQNLRQLNNRFESTAEQISDFNRRQADGEHPDPSEFMDLLSKQSVTRTAMSAQFGLMQKPLKTVLNETR